MKIFVKWCCICVVLVCAGDAHDIVIAELASTGDGSVAGDLCH
jgi:hypothetical protein